MTERAPITPDSTLFTPIVSDSPKISPIRRCKDCVAEGVTTTRKLATKRDGTLKPGPRCVTHDRARKKVLSAQGHGKRLESVYGITAEEYAKLYQAQGGRCYLCRVASGAARRLAVDHDHDTGLVRGLCCGRCNLMIGIWGIPGVLRALEYLHNPPAIAVIGHRRVPVGGAPMNATEGSDPP